jgi:FAD/FMN-containing dehydrogenase
MINYKKIEEDLKLKISGEIVSDISQLRKVSRDASLFTVMPKLLIYPKDKFDISKIVTYVKELKKDENFKELSITVRAAGTDMSGGPLNDSIILDVTKYMNQILDFSVKEKTVVCEPGLYYRDLEKRLEPAQLFFPSYPASKDLCCIGGIVSNNSAGEKTLLYGQTIDWVEEVEVVLETGEIKIFKEVKVQNIVPGSIEEKVFSLYQKEEENILNGKPKTSKNASGYNIWSIYNPEKETINLAKIIVGSQGTLGIITSAKLKLTETKKATKLVTVFLTDLKLLVEVVHEVLKFNPESLESFDDHTFKVAFKFLPSILWKMKGSVVELGLSFIPEMIMALTGGIPKLILLVEFTGKSEEEVNFKALDCLQALKKFPYKSRITKNEVDVSKYWTFRRESFNLLRSKLKGLRTAPFVEDVVIPVDKMPEFIPKMQEILDRHKFTYTIAGHAGNGNFHIIPLMKMTEQSEIDKILECNEEVFSLVGKLGGSLSAEHNDGLVRTPYLHYMFDEKMLGIFSSLKNLFDPLNFFNPGKKVGGTIKENYSKIELTK